MEAFRGNHTAKVEEGGRLKLPGPFKKLLDDANVTQFYITSIDGVKAQIWPLPAWEKQEELLAELNAEDDSAEKYLDLTSYYGAQVEMDKQARVQLPQILRASANLDAEVAVRGMLNHIVVENLRNLEENLQAIQLTSENRKTLGPVLRPRSDK